MKNNFYARAFIALLCAGASGLLTSCSDDHDPLDPTPDTDAETAYVIAAQDDGTSYLITAPSLDEGTATVRGTGTEVIGGTYWVFKNQHHLFALVYNKGGAGTGASYYLNAAGKPAERYTYEFNRITTYGTWGDKVVTVSTGDSKTTDGEGNIAQALLFNYLDENTGGQTESAIDAENFLGNGEKVTFAGLEEANGKLYTSVVPMGMSRYGIGQWPEKVTDQALVAKADGGSASSAYTAGTIPSTQYPDHAYIAIYSGSSFAEKPVIASTDRIGFACGRYRSQYYQTIWAADNGDLYVFSPGYGRTFTSSADLKKVTGTKPSGAVRIRKGETAFDPDYYVDFEQIGTKHPIYRCWHISGTHFLLQLYSGGVEGMMQGTQAEMNELAVFDAEAKTVVPVTGLPDDLAGFGGEPYGENGAMYIAVTVTGGDKPAFYKIDAATGRATKGLVIDAESVATAGKLTIQK
ncbi:MAG: DUF4374 domain-containing protein [Alistipes senegalensis]|nr:DUF4374 domain-containing protein [Bacteroides cellulosilyticus]MCM1351513.1 DUF4374 domain-containing protein [Alistipes senegalensis]